MKANQETKNGVHVEEIDLPIGLISYLEKKTKKRVIPLEKVDTQ
jgi:hypothetical protein